MWSERERERKKVKLAIRNETLAGMTRLNFSSKESESQNTGMFLKHRRTNKRKTWSTCGCLMFSFFSFYPLALLCALRLDSVGAGHTGDPKENVLETFVGISPQAWRRHWHMLTRLSPSTKHSRLSTENKFIFVWHPVWASCPVFFITASQNECLITAVTRLRDSMTGHQMTHRSSRQTVTRPLGTVVPFRTELQKHAMSTLCGCNKISGRLSREYEPRGKKYTTVLNSRYTQNTCILGGSIKFPS